MISPARVAHADRAKLILEGDQRRFISPNTPVRALLCDDLQQMWLTAATRREGRVDWCVMALANHAWDGYHHTMRQLSPPSWVDAALFDKCVMHIRNCVPESAEYDKRVGVCVGDVVFYASAHARTANEAWHFVWAPVVGWTERLEAAMVSTVHGIPCTVVNVRTGCMVRVVVPNRLGVLERLAM